jgi:hypothetical protein
MAWPPTASDLASYLKQDVDTATANLALTVSLALFEKIADTKFSAQTSTYQVEGRGQPVIAIPHEPLISIQQVRVAGAILATTEYTVVMNNLYRVIGWGRIWGSTNPTAPYVGFPPELVEVDHTYGYATGPDDVRGAVLETAGAMYISPDITTRSEAIDDYSVETMPKSGGVMLSPAAMALAEKYRSGGFA